jgi:hypothetical protein
MRTQHRPKRARREFVAAVIGAEVGGGIGLLAVGASPLVPLGLAAAGAAIGAGAVSLRHVLIRRWVRSQLRPDV